MSHWDQFIRQDFDFADFRPDDRVLDVGCGPGDQLAALRARGCRAVGVDLSLGALQESRAKGLGVSRAVAEWLPIRSASVDGVICKVVLPYTDERRAVSELARVLRPGGSARISGHGSGYFLWYIVHGANIKFRIYGMRSLVNTLVYRLTGHRLWGFLGDTIAQSERSLARAYRPAGLRLDESVPAPRFLGRPVFLYHRLTRVT